jgi:uncharacterized protein (TIGR00255 family)
MTGYGRGECTMYERKFTVEIKAVNHRYNDITVKLPRAIMGFEDEIKKAISKKVFRGKLDVFVNFESFSQEDINISVNEPLAKSYTETLRKLKSDLHLDGDVTIEIVSKFPDVITVDKSISNENTENEIRECLMKAVEDATDAFVAMREVEGETLKKNIIEKVAFVNDALQKIEERAPWVSKDYRARLEAKLADLDEIQVDESRLLTEVLLFADKACIDEEITRLHSHISQMYSIVEENVPVGRKLDFLVQEMNRETNTIGSKSNDIEITNHVVDIKSEIEKIREQIQNIE